METRARRANNRQITEEGRAPTKSRRLRRRRYHYARDSLSLSLYQGQKKIYIMQRLRAVVFYRLLPSFLPRPPASLGLL